MVMGVSMASIETLILTTRSRTISARRLWELLEQVKSHTRIISSQMTIDPLLLQKACKTQDGFWSQGSKSFNLPSMALWNMGRLTHRVLQTLSLINLSLSPLIPKARSYSSPALTISSAQTKTFHYHLHTRPLRREIPKEYTQSLISIINKYLSSSLPQDSQWSKIISSII